MKEDHSGGPYPRILRFAIGAVFVAAGVAKIADPTGFLAAILAYHLPLPMLQLKLAAIIIPWVELFTGMLVAIGIWVDAGLVVTGGLSILFITVAAQAAIRGIPVQCGCFGALSESMPSFMNSLPFVLGRDFLLAGVTVTLAWRHLRQGRPASTR